MPQQVLTLPSNSSMTFYPENMRSRYKVELATPLMLEGPHEVALVGLHYTRSWYNFSSQEVYNVRYDREGESPGAATASNAEGEGEAETVSRTTRSVPSYRPYSLHMEHGHYLDIWQVLLQLNQKRAAVEWTYSDASRRVSLIWKEPGWTMWLNDSAARKMGWPGEVTLVRPVVVPRKIRAPGVVNLDDVDLLHVHCDLAADSHPVGDKKKCRC